jgi:hypothetical protein
MPEDDLTTLHNDDGELDRRRVRRIQELEAIVTDLARCDVSEWVYTHPINCPDDVDPWELIERARKAGA